MTRILFLLATIAACGFEPEAEEGQGGKAGTPLRRDPPAEEPSRDPEGDPCGDAGELTGFSVPVECEPFYVERGRPPEKGQSPENLFTPYEAETPSDPGGR